MPSALTYPGVYIEEPPSGVRTIVGVATSVAAFVGRAPKGPVSQPIVINSYADFERRFGGLWIESSLGYAVRDFYLNGGNQAVIVRLFNGSEAQARVAATEVATAAAKAGSAAGATAASVATAVTAAATAASTGTASTAAAKFVETAVTGVAGAAGAPTPKAVVDAAQKAIAGAVLAGIDAEPNKAQLKVDSLDLEASSEGAWGNQLRARIDTNMIGKTAADKSFNLTVRDLGSGATEVFRNVSVSDTDSRQVANVLKNESRLVRAVLPLPSAVPKPNDDPDPNANPRPNIWDTNKVNKLSSGVSKEANDGVPLTQNNFVGPGMDAAKMGLYALRDADIFNLLCIPPYLKNSDINHELIPFALAFCAERRAMMLIDPPPDWHDKDSAKKVSMFAGDNNNKNAAIFFPRLTQPNSLRDNQLEDFAPCGAVAGVFARTDTTRGVWKAPAGLDAMLGGVPQLSVPLTDLEIGELNPLGVNCLRTMAAAGRVVWGSRTLLGDDRLTSEWKYIPVRRTALFIEESLYRATQWIVFEPNDEPLWSQIRLNIGAFMHDLFRKGAFQGTTPKDAYFVKCDKETTTQSDINLGIVNIVVGFAPLKPAEFVVIKLQQMAGQIDV
jgi:uncharacterized protein